MPLMKAIVVSFPLLLSTIFSVSGFLGIYLSCVSFPEHRLLQYFLYFCGFNGPFCVDGTVKPKKPKKLSVVAFQYPNETMAKDALCLQKACQEIAIEKIPRELRHRHKIVS